MKKAEPKKTMYCAEIHKNKITPVEVFGVEEHTLWLKLPHSITEVLKETPQHKYFDSIEEARDHILTYLSSRIEETKRVLKRSEDNLVLIKAASFVLIEQRKKSKKRISS